MRCRESRTAQAHMSPRGPLLSSGPSGASLWPDAVDVYGERAHGLAFLRAFGTAAEQQEHADEAELRLWSRVSRVEETLETSGRSTSPPAVTGVLR